MGIKRDRKEIQNIQNQTKRLQSTTNRGNNKQTLADAHSRHSDSTHQRACVFTTKILFIAPNQIRRILVGKRRSRSILSSRNVIIFKKCITRIALLACTVGRCGAELRSLCNPREPHATLCIHRQARRLLTGTGHLCCPDPLVRKRMNFRC